MDLMLTGRATETTLDTYSNMPAAATHSRSTTSRGDPQQEHDHRRFRADHEAIEQDAPTIRASSSSDGKLIVAPDARVAVRLGQARALPGGPCLRLYVFHMLGGVTELLEVVGHGAVQSHRPKIELIGHSRAGAFKPRLRVEPTVVTQTRSVQIVGNT